VSSKCFQLYYTCSDRLLTIALPSCSVHRFPLLLWRFLSSQLFCVHYRLSRNSTEIWTCCLQDTKLHCFCDRTNFQFLWTQCYSFWEWALYRQKFHWAVSPHRNNISIDTERERIITDTNIQCLTTDCKTGVRSPTDAKDFSCSLCVQTGSELHPASCTVGIVVLSPGVKRGREVTLASYPYSSEAMKE
jgi:hypothetical protein